MKTFKKNIINSFAILMVGSVVSLPNLAVAENHGMKKHHGKEGNCEMSEHGEKGKAAKRGAMRQRLQLGKNQGAGNRQGKMMERFAIVDTNSDDRIGADEAAAWRESVFAAMDADDSNDLTLEEFMAVRMGNQEGRNPQKQARKQEEKKARFLPMDSDNSGQVSIGEFLIAGKARFDNADQDGDGIVSPWEFRANRKGR